MVEVEVIIGERVIFSQAEQILACRERGYRAGGIRTRGLLHPRQALYQAEPQPELFAAPRIRRGARFYFAYSGESGKIEYASSRAGLRRKNEFRPG